MHAQACDLKRGCTRTFLRFSCRPAPLDSILFDSSASGTVESLLQSTVGAQQNIQWKVVVLARERRLCFRLVVAGSSTVAPSERVSSERVCASERVCGFRLAPSTELCQSFGCTLADDGWLTAETAVDGLLIAGHQTLGSVPVDVFPTARGTKQDARSVRRAGEEVTAPMTAPPEAAAKVVGEAAEKEKVLGGEGWLGWRGALRWRVGRRLQAASNELSDIGMQARESGASLIKLMRHPIASFAVPLHVVVRREMVSMHRPPHTHTCPPKHAHTRTHTTVAACSLSLSF